MIAKPPLIITCSIIVALCFSSALQAQNLDVDPILRDTSNAFCKQLALVISQIDTHFDHAKDSLMDTTGQKTWSCKEKYKMAGARSCEIYQRGGTSLYAAFYLSRDSKDALESSYNNLVQQLKDCMGTNFVYKERKTSAAEKLMGINNYECEMRPGSDSAPEPADMRVSVQKDNLSGNYELILEIKKHSGYY